MPKSLTLITHGVTALLLLTSLTPYSYGQVVTSRTLMADLSSKLTYRPQLDPSININRLSREQCNTLIERMYVIDQQYRKEIGSDISRQDAAAQKAWRFMVVNDRSNQAILLKILNRFGWPCNDPQRQLGHKAYLVVWHARGDYDKMSVFYRYLQKATQQRCMTTSYEQEYGMWLTSLKRAYQR